MMTRDPTQDVSQTSNDRIHGVLWGTEAEEGSFLCECGRPSCTEKVAMTCSEYVRLRDREELILAPGHEQLSTRTVA
jgi:hypothetical protein